jgi:hypothetical protein
MNMQLQPQAVTLGKHGSSADFRPHATGCFPNNHNNHSSNYGDLLLTKLALGPAYVPCPDSAVHPPSRGCPHSQKSCPNSHLRPTAIAPFITVDLDATLANLLPTPLNTA